LRIREHAARTTAHFSAPSSYTSSITVSPASVAGSAFTAAAAIWAPRTSSRPLAVELAFVRMRPILISAAIVGADADTIANKARSLSFMVSTGIAA
jgi:hypothetical protein